jgi:nicotinate-nucleotide pyrophosphorylase (carboxylating)
MGNNALKEFILRSLAEDLGDGDHTSLACISASETGKAKLLIKEKGILAGIRVAEEIFKIIDINLKFDLILEDGKYINPGILDSIFQGASNQF